MYIFYVHEFVDLILLSGTCLWSQALAKDFLLLDTVGRYWAHRVKQQAGTLNYGLSQNGITQIDC